GGTARVDDVEVRVRRRGARPEVDGTDDTPTPGRDEIERARAKAERMRAGRPRARRSVSGSDDSADRAARSQHDEGSGGTEPAATVPLTAREGLALEGATGSTGHLAAGRVSVTGGLRECRLENGIELHRQFRASLREAWRRFVQMREDDRQLAVPLEWS